MVSEAKELLEKFKNDVAKMKEQASETSSYNCWQFDEMQAHKMCG